MAVILYRHRSNGSQILSYMRQYDIRIGRMRQCQTEGSTAEWHCSQLVGYSSRSQQLIQQDHINALSFSPDGTLLAAGDQAGRVILFKAEQSEPGQPSQYEYVHEQQAHFPILDTLHNNPLEEGVQHIHWLRPQGEYNKLLTADHYNVKLWKVREQPARAVVRPAQQQQDWLELPQMGTQQPTTLITLKNVYKNVYLTPVHTVQPTHHEEYLFTGDPLRLYLWSMHDPTQPYLLRELQQSKIPSKEEKSERITCSQMHPQRDSLFIYGTNKGELRLEDIRVSRSSPQTLTFRGPPVDSYLSDMICGYSDVSMTVGKREIVTRDLLSIKVWDVAMNKEPVANLPVDPVLPDNLCHLFQNDQLNDRFCLTRVGDKMLTGSYGGNFHLISPTSHQNTQYTLDYDQNTISRQINNTSTSEPQLPTFNPQSRIQAHSYSPLTRQLAVSTRSCFFIYSQ